MSDYLNMVGNYEQRKVERFDNGVFIIDTVMVWDRHMPYESAISHPEFNDGEWIVLGWSKTKEDAQKDHEKWVKYFTENTVDEITDVYNGITFRREF